MVNSDVNNMVVSAIANTAIVLRSRAAFRLLSERRRIHFLFATLNILPSPPYNLPILNADNPLGKLGNFFIMGNHNNCLPKFFTADFHQA